MGITNSPEQITRDLEELWASLGGQGEQGSGVLRASSMSLLVLADEGDDPARIGETLAAIMPEYPSRAILIRVRAAAERLSQVRVSAQCWEPFGQRRQICCEKVEMDISEPSLADVPGLVAPVLIPELPVVLWCRGARIFEMPAFQAIAALAGKLLIDSEAFPEPEAILKRMAELAGTGRVLSDLAWTRLTRWRELIAQIFENPSYLAQLPEVAEVRIRVAGGKITVPARYLAAWLTAGIRTAGGAAKPVFSTGAGGGAGTLLRVELMREGVLASIAMVDGNTAEIRAGEMVSRATLAPPSDSRLLREELAITGRDPIYENTLPAAATLAISSST
ncbi:MAG: glucose-6-phosphate dehydrogenase assembly protein OpcA [Acidobacteria bacterium]|nr:glucose-6-phosphate dehydrogenase assembly protein OpcA [Acidobacteriota bacterium]